LLASEPRLAKILTRAYPRSVCISSQNEEDIKKCRETIVEFLAQNMLEKTLYVDYGDSKMLSLIYAHTRVLESEWAQEQGVFKVRMTKSVYQRYFSPFDTVSN
jgi:GTP-binding protein HflX